MAIEYFTAHRLDAVVEDRESCSRLPPPRIVRGPTGGRIVRKRRTRGAYAVFYVLGDPFANGLDLLVVVPEYCDCRRWAVEYGNRIAPVLDVAVDVFYHLAKQAMVVALPLVYSRLVTRPSAS
jgi:hypothetical protein